jgi:hypothetical protein
MIDFLNNKKTSIGVCISGHLDYKIRGPQRTKMIFNKKKDIKEFLYNSNEIEFEQYDPEIGHKYLKQLLKKYNLEYFIHTWSIDKKKNILQSYNPEKFLCEKQIFFPFELDPYGIIEEDRNIDNWKVSSNAKLGYKSWWESRKNQNINYNFEDFLNEIRIQIFRTTSRYYSLSNSIDLALNYKKKYKFYLVTRFGANFSFFWKFNIKQLLNNTMYCEKRLNRKDEDIAINDMWFLTDYNGLEILKKIYDERFDYCTRPPIAFREHFEKYKLNLRLIDPPNRTSFYNKIKIKIKSLIKNN